MAARAGQWWTVEVLESLEFLCIVQDVGHLWWGCIHLDGNALLFLPKDGLFLNVGQWQQRQVMERMGKGVHGEGNAHFLPADVKAGCAGGVLGLS